MTNPENYNRLFFTSEKQKAAQESLGIDLTQFAQAVHGHDAAAIQTGVIAPARLGTGTPAGTKVLYGNGTWDTLPGGGGGGLSDGDYGDISVSGGGAALTIDNGVVTLAKMADLATDRLIGRATAGSGAPEAITCTAAARALLDDADAAAMRATLGVAFAGALVEKTNNQSVTSAGAAASWDAAAYDVGGWWSAGSPTRLTVPSGVSRVRLAACCRTSTNNVNITGHMLKNASDVFAGNPGSYAYSATGGLMLVSSVVAVTAGDYFEVFYWPPSTLNLIGGSGRRSWFSIEAVA
jgi:hypothetical protein